MISELASGIAMGLGTLGVGLGLGIMGYGVASGISRNPDASGEIFIRSIVFAAFCEGIGIINLIFAVFLL